MVLLSIIINIYTKWNNALTGGTPEAHFLGVPPFRSRQICSKSTLWFINLYLMVPTENPKCFFADYLSVMMLP